MNLRRSSRLVRSKILVAGLCLPVVMTAGAQAPRDHASDVNVLIGTGTSPVKDHGLTMPAASLPFGMIAWGPDPDQGGFYHYEQADTRGFSMTHLNGVGCPIFGDVPVMPVNGAIGSSPAQRPTVYKDTYSHANEAASPGFYSVKLDSGIAVQLAAALRSGMATMNFPDARGPHSIVVDLSRTQSRFGIHAAEVHAVGRLITGAVTSGGFCSRDNRYRVFFALETEEAPASIGTFDSRTVSKTVANRSGTQIGGWLTYPAGTRTVHLRAGISFVSAANALENLRAEIPGWDLAKVRDNARTAWNDALGRIEVTGGTAEHRRIFYSALYHSLLEPSTFSDDNGQYLGFDERVHTVRPGHRQYANYSGWDIYRSQVQLIAMLDPKVASDMAESLVVDAEQGGGLPIWPVAGDESAVMVGDPADLILAGVYAFGARDFDTKAAVAAMIRGADEPATHVRLYPERPMSAEYLAKGYVPETAASGGSASMSLEYANADFAISRMAGAMGDGVAAARFLERSANWRKLFDAKTRYIRARDVNGDFLPNFTPGDHRGFVEGNSAQYTWMTPYDLKSVIEAVGGDSAAKARLDDYFSQYASFNGGPYFLISNEPSFPDPWIYNWTGHPWRTQEVVAKTLKDLFTDTPGGLPGNDDLGATSSWAVFAMLGIYPAIPAVGGVTLNTPTFPHATINLQGHLLSIEAEEAEAKAYIGSVALDGKAVKDFWIPWEDLHGAKTLRFSLATSPDTTPGASRPPSFAPPAH